MLAALDQKKLERTPKDKNKAQQKRKQKKRNLKRQTKMESAPKASTANQRMVRNLVIEKKSQERRRKSRKSAKARIAWRTKNATRKCKETVPPHRIATKTTLMTEALAAEAHPLAILILARQKESSKS